MKENKVIAICYDFDKTLGIKEASLSYGFFDDIGVDEDVFWNSIVKSDILKNMDHILANMYYTLFVAKQKNFKLTKEVFESYGKNVIFYDGLDTWFDRINNYAKNKGYKVEHYIISAGLKEIISNTKIAKYFKKIYASTYLYDKDGTPIWPSTIINSTEKTQYLYRIKKNFLKENDPRINEKVENRVPFSNMIYIGDSFTDVPCMSIVIKNGGTSIGVYDDLPAKKELMQDLFNKNRINNFCKANYSEGSEIEQVVQKAIDKIKLNDEIQKLTEDLIK